MACDQLFLFVRPPRPVWPFNGPASTFWPPLAYASLGAALRQSIPDLRVEILDCGAFQMGWKSLSAELESRRPDYVGIGEEAVSCADGLRLATIARELGAKVVAGGCTYGHLAPEVLGTGLVDAVVHGEGERTIVELVEALRSRRQDEELARVDGISYARQGEVIRTRPRALIADLDTLPLPAYDLLPVSRYGSRSKNHPDFASIEHGRGCIANCDFCILWRQMGRWNGTGVVPCYRTKSPERVMEEIRILATRYGRRYLHWVDPTFNADSTFLDRLSEAMLREGLRLGASAWLRADGIVRDEERGILEKVVAAGLNEVYVGIERPEGPGLDFLHKTGNSYETVKAAMTILSERYPSVFTVGSMIYGLPADSPETMNQLQDVTFDLQLDFTFYIPLTGLPGTPYWRSGTWDGTGERLRRQDFLPQTAHDGTGRLLTEALMRAFFLDLSAAHLRHSGRKLLCRDTRKRRMHWRLLRRATAFGFKILLPDWMSANGCDGQAMQLPRWYND